MYLAFPKSVCILFKMFSFLFKLYNRQRKSDHFYLNLTFNLTILTTQVLPWRLTVLGVFLELSIASHSLHQGMKLWQRFRQ